MKALAALAVASCLAGRPLVAQTGEFLVRLGSDTLAIERYTRTPDRLTGEQVVRAPRTVHRLYTLQFGADGAATAFELVQHNVSGGPGPRETRSTALFHGDSALVRAPDGDSITTLRVRATTGALPFVLQWFALVNELTRRAHAAGGQSYTAALLPLGDTALVQASVTPRGSDSVTITLGQIGPLRARVDPQGNLLGLTGIGSVMQVTVERVRGLDFAALGKSFAARSLGTLSPADSVQASVGSALLSIRYSRPSARGRVIFGNVVPWNRVWRTGANQATVLETSADLVVGDAAIPAGRYSLWTIPGPGEWTLIINKNAGQWGTQYEDRYDFARVKLAVASLPQPVEQFTIAVESKGTSAVLQLEWERTRASVPLAAK